MAVPETKCCDKFLLTVSEASSYFNIGDRKLRSILAEHPDQPLYIQNGVKVLIKRKNFERFLENVTSL